MQKEDFMRLAIADARKNGLHFGAVIVKDNKIIVKSGRRPNSNPLHHAETKAVT